MKGMMFCVHMILVRLSMHLNTLSWRNENISKSYVLMQPKDLSFILLLLLMNLELQEGLVNRM